MEKKFETIKYKIIEPDKKYELIESDRKGLFRIKALRDFGDVKKGDIGGYVEAEDNLSQYGDCWIYNDAKVYGYAQVYANAKVKGYAKVIDNAIIRGNAVIVDFAIVKKGSVVTDDSLVYEHAIITDNVVIGGKVRIGGDATMQGSICIKGDCSIYNDSDYRVYKNDFSSGRYFVYTKSNKMWQVGCFYGTSWQLIKKAFNDSFRKGIKYTKYVIFNKLL